MTVEKILTGVCELMMLDKTVLDRDGKERALLVKCLNMVLREIAEEYVPFLIKEDVYFSNGFYPYDRLSEQVKSVKRVESEGLGVEFTAGPDGIYADLKSAKITYAYIPDEVSYGDSLKLPVKVTERALIYGTASEYSLMTEQYEECVNLNSRYVKAVSSAVRPLKSIRVKKRRWI